LLETLYGAYDTLAEKWGVYKVSQQKGLGCEDSTHRRVVLTMKQIETIGDS
jgi:hypothetical protein